MIRRATLEDAREIGELHLRAWWWAYREIVDHAVLAEHDPDSRERDWTAALEAGRVAWVRIEAERIVGFVVVDGAELRALYVDPAAQGAGVGSALLTFAEEQIAAAGHARAHLWTLKFNEHARGFYEGRGWTADGEEDARDWGPEVRYAKDLPDA